MSFHDYADRHRPEDEDAAVRAEAEEIRLLDALEQDHSEFTIAPGAENIIRALAAWAWLDLPDLRPILVNAFGEIFFLQGPEGGKKAAVVMLDTLGGSIQPVAENLAAFSATLETEEGQDDLLVAGLVNALRDRGELLGADECYDYKLAPVLGGDFEPGNIEAVDFVSKHIAVGELHRELAEAAT